MSQNMDYARTSLVSQIVKNLPAMQETGVQSLHWEDPLRKEMVTRSSIIAWEIPWTEEPGRQSETTEATNTYLLVDYAIK